MNGPEVFEKHYEDYRVQIARIDLERVQERLGGELRQHRLVIPFYDTLYFVSPEGITDGLGNRPDYMRCVILAKYILSCPDRPPHAPEWVAFKDMKRASHFVNVNYFSSDTEKAIASYFSGRLEALSRACQALGGRVSDTDAPYDLSMEFTALPRISLLLLFNNRDENFPAQCTVLFQRQAEYFLDPESLAMTGACLARSLRRLA